MSLVPSDTTPSAGSLLPAATATCMPGLRSRAATWRRRPSGPMTMAPSDDSATSCAMAERALTRMSWSR